jgi:hypothetical protein
MFVYDLTGGGLNKNGLGLRLLILLVTVFAGWFFNSRLLPSLVRDDIDFTTRNSANHNHHETSDDITCKLYTAACLYIKEENHRLIEWYVSLCTMQYNDSCFWIWLSATTFN